MRRLTSIVLAGAAAVLLSACATTTPSVDLDVARDWVEEVVEAQSDGPGAAGHAVLQVDGEGDEAPDGSEEDGIRLDFAASANVVRADARCYGDGTNVVEVGVTVYSENGAEAYSYGQTVACDKEAHTIQLGEGMLSSAVLIEATADTATYAHVTIIEELVVER